MFSHSHRISAITLSLSSLLGAAAALAAAPAEAAPTSISVSYRDLDLARPTDVQTLYRRLKNAAAQVCAPLSDRALARQRAYTRCYQSALDSAVLEVRSPELLALYRATDSSKA